jgi:hypothetical protein
MVSDISHYTGIQIIFLCSLLCYRNAVKSTLSLYGPEQSITQEKASFYQFLGVTTGCTLDWNRLHNLR